MKAVYFNEHGDIDNIKVGEVKVPPVHSNEVLIESKYAALNHLDLFTIKGVPGLTLSMPHIMGSDGSGIIKEVGDEVSLCSPGDRVLINPGISCGKCFHCLAGKQNLCPDFVIKGEHIDGTFAEFFKVPEINVLKIPKDFSFVDVAGAPLNFLTAWRMVKSRANVQPNEYVFIHGAGGGVSSAAIQIAKLLGATVIATTSTKEKMDKAREIGADYVLNYIEEPNYSKTTYKEITNKKGVDVVIDSVGQATFNTSMRLLKPNGRLVTCGATTGPEVSVDIRRIFWNQLNILGSTMSNQKEFREVMELVFAKKLKPIVDKVFPIDQAAEAERYLQEGKQFGKVLLKISE
jgi:NADPH:quinone reductase-like Zn-dependent oxidoreductase